MKCEQSIDKLTVQAWLLYHHQNFKYCTLFESGTELKTDKQTETRKLRLSDETRKVSFLKSFKQEQHLLFKIPPTEAETKIHMYKVIPNNFLFTKHKNNAEHVTLTFGA